MRIDQYIPRPSLPRYVCYPESLGLYENEPEHRETRASGQLQEYNLHVVMDGQGYVDCGSRRYELVPGSGFLYGPGLPQQYGSDRDKPWKVWWVHFYGESVEWLLENRGRYEPWVFQFSGIERLESLLLRMQALCSPYRTEQEAVLSATLYELLLELVQHSERLSMSSALTAKSAIRETADLIRIHCGRELSLSDMAKWSGFSTYYFARLFKQVMGIAPNEFLIQSRIVKAKQLLASTPLSVKEIAGQVGFNSSSYLIQRFHEREGMTPGEFRRLYGYSNQ